jgi:hypothetical protein
MTHAKKLNESHRVSDLRFFRSRISVHKRHLIIIICMITCTVSKQHHLHLKSEVLTTIKFLWWVLECDAVWACRQILPATSRLKMEAVHSSQTLVPQHGLTVYKTTTSTIRIYFLKSHIFMAKDCYPNAQHPRWIIRCLLLMHFHRVTRKSRNPY